MMDIQARIAARLRELHLEIDRLEQARQALSGEGSQPRQRRRGGRRAQSRPSSRRRRRQTRMDPREREAQALHRIREHGAEGVSITDLAQQIGVSRSYLTSRILPPLDAQISRTRGKVAAK
jgi:YesN/AraC family two-component response regulator